MVRRFNTVGPCRREHHYILAPQERLPTVLGCIDAGSYFWLYGSRQTGKTTALSILAADLTAKGKYASVLVSAAAASVSAYEEAIAEDAFLYELREAAQYLPKNLQPPLWEYEVPGQRIRAALSAWAQQCPRPLVIFIDDVDTLEERTLISLLRQIKGGCAQRPQRFPHAVGFVSLRDVNQLPLVWGRRSSRQEWMTPGRLCHSMIDVRLALQGFSVEDVANIYNQNTKATGQLFTLEAVDRAFELTQGQPWLVNILANQVINSTQGPIESYHIDAASDALIEQQISHIDHLPIRLEEASVQAILEPLLMGQPLPQIKLADIFSLLDLGLCRFDSRNRLVLANPLYQLLVLNQLSFPALASLLSLDFDRASWIKANGSIDGAQVLQELLTYWQQFGDRLMLTMTYQAIAPYLAVAALFRRIAQEHGPLTQVPRFDQNQLELTWSTGASSIHIIIMVQRDEQSDPVAQGLSTLDPLLSINSNNQGWLVIVDQRRERQPSHNRTQLKSMKTPSGKTVEVFYS